MTEKETKKATAKTQAAKKTIRVKDAVTVYMALRGVDAARLPLTDDNAKADLFGIIRATRALRPVAEAQRAFELDAAERLRPADFKTLEEKRRKFDTLTPEERREVADAFNAYDRAFTECVTPVQAKEVEIDAFDPLGERAIAAIAAASENMPLETLVLIQDICGE